jgi:hypothetical protein
MDIPDTEYWCMYRAALWIMTQSFDVRDAVLDAELKPPTNALLNDQQRRRYNALTWLEEHKTAMLSGYREWYVEKALELAFDELASDIWFELACENVREKRGERFKSHSELRAAIEDKRMYVHAQTLVRNFPRRTRGRPPKTPAQRQKDAYLVAAVEDLCRTGLTKRKAYEALHREMPNRRQSAEAVRKRCERAKKHTLKSGTKIPN